MLTLDSAQQTTEVAGNETNILLFVPRFGLEIRRFGEKPSPSSGMIQKSLKKCLRVKMHLNILRVTVPLVNLTSCMTCLR